MNYADATNMLDEGKCPVCKQNHLPIASYPFIENGEVKGIVVVCESGKKEKFEL